MAKRKVFYSFHYDNDCWRTQQVRNMGVLDKDEPVTPNRWEEIKRSGVQAIKNWINNTMDTCSCLVVLIGSETARRPWVRYEIETAWNKGKGVVGIYIDALHDQYGRASIRGANPFDQIPLTIGYNTVSLSAVVRTFDPSRISPVLDIKNNIEQLVNEAILTRQRY